MKINAVAAQFRCYTVNRYRFLLCYDTGISFPADCCGSRMLRICFPGDVAEPRYERYHHRIRAYR
jgi:hypothetical protein